MTIATYRRRELLRQVIHAIENQVAAARRVVSRDFKDPADSTKCATEMAKLSEDITKAANDLETARTQVAITGKGDLANQVATVIAVMTAVSPTRTPTQAPAVPPTP